ncbi:MAG: hypothetical protein JST39_23200, partial [Bacteroidetes bacterium]|nr:hypothetical protein [Bacteroidota bacterium]
MEMTLMPAQRWPMARKIAVLFAACYFFFLVMDFTSSDEIFPAFVYKLFAVYVKFWDWIVPWTGEHILHVGYPITVKPNGSGDTTYNWVMQLLWIILALLIAIVWALVDRKRPSYRQLLYWLRIFMRYYFAFVLFIYGSVKIIKLQFPFPGLSRLVEPYGDSSPMGLAWTFVGYSKGYNIFTGGAEILAGVLLFFRRTTLLGSLLALTIMANVAAMNMFYDIPVKIFSLNLVCLALFLLTPDFVRLKNLFWLNAPVPPADMRMPAKTRWKVIFGRVLKWAFILFTAYQTLWLAWVNSSQYGDAAPKPPLYGIYNVETFT